MEYPHPGGALAPAMLLTTGARVEVELALGTKLASGQTYVFLLGTNANPLESVQVAWDSAAILTITVETSNLPENIAAAYSSTAGHWVQENPSTANVSVSPAGAGTPTAATVAVPGGAAGAAMYEIGNLGAKRTRIKVVVGGAGGFVMCAPHGKGSGA